MGGRRLEETTTETDVEDWTLDDCSPFFDKGGELAVCYQENEKTLKYDINMCNSITWLDTIMSNMEQMNIDFFPAPELYFKCYYDKTPMKDTAKFQTEKVAACDKLHSTSQFELLRCYDYIKHPYNLDAQIKVCTDEFKALSELDELYKCME